MSTDARLRQVRFVEPLHLFDKKDGKDDGALQLQHCLGWKLASTTSSLPLTPFLRHDVSVSLTANGTFNRKNIRDMQADATGQTAMQQQGDQQEQEQQHATSTTATTSIYNQWEPHVGCCTLRYVERLAEKMTCDNDQHHLLTKNQNNKNNNSSSSAADADEGVQLDKCSVALCATRDQLAADFSLYPGDAAWIDHGSGTVRCDSVVGDCVVHDFHFAVVDPPSVATEDALLQQTAGHQAGHVAIARNSLIPDDEYFAMSYFGDKKQQQQHQSPLTFVPRPPAAAAADGSPPPQRLSVASSTAASSAAAAATGGKNKQQHAVAAPGYLRLLAGDVCFTPDDVPLLSGCPIPSEAPLRNGISLFAIECVVKPGATLRVPLSAERHHRQHRSCVALVIGGAVRILNGDVDPVGVRCCRGDAIALGAVGDAVQLRCSPEQDCPAGATVLIVSAKTVVPNSNNQQQRYQHEQHDFAVVSAATTPHMNSCMFAQSGQILQRRMQRYDEGILARLPATIRTVRPLEVKNKNRQRRLLLFPHGDKEVTDADDPLEGSAGQRGLCLLSSVTETKRNSSSSNADVAVVVVSVVGALSDDGTTLQRLKITTGSNKKSIEPLEPISFVQDTIIDKNKSTLGKRAHGATAANPLVEVVTTVSILGKKIVLGFAPAVDAVVLCKNPTARVTVEDGTAAETEEHQEEQQSSVMVSWYHASPLFALLRQKLRCASTALDGTFSIVGAAELHGTDLALFCNSHGAGGNHSPLSPTAPESSHDHEETAVEVATIKSAELWKFLMTTSPFSTMGDEEEEKNNNSNDATTTTTTTTNFFASLTVQEVALPTLDTGARTRFQAASAPLAATGASRNDALCTVQLRPLPANQYIKSTLTLLQSMSGATREVRRRPAAGCGLVIASSASSGGGGGKVSSSSAMQLAEFCPLACRVPLSLNVQHQMRMEKLAAIGARPEQQEQEDGDCDDDKDSAVTVSSSSRSDDAASNNNNITTTNNNVVDDDAAAAETRKRRQSVAIAHSAIASHYVREVPNISGVRGLLQLDAAGNFLVLYSVAPGDEVKTEVAAEALPKRQRRGGGDGGNQYAWQDDFKVGIATLVSEKNTRAIPEEEEVQLALETLALRARINDGFKPAL